MDRITAHITRTIATKQSILGDPNLLDAIRRVARHIEDSFRSSSKLLIAGNGGSAADAQHFAGEMVCRYRFNRPALPAVALSTDTSVMTAVGNDLGFDDVFARQVEALGRPGDVLLGISTSGKSPNIIRALHAGRRIGLSTIGFAGADPSAMSDLCDFLISIPSGETPIVQECHIMIIHIICRIVEEELFPGDDGPK